MKFSWVLLPFFLCALAEADVLPRQGSNEAGVHLAVQPRHDGGPLAPAVIIPPSPFAGGRSTNGKLWVENIADAVGATLMDYAWSSAVTNISLWPSNPRPRDFIMQTTMFLKQANELDPDTTLPLPMPATFSSPMFTVEERDAKGEAWLQSIFDGLMAFHAQDLLRNVAFANFATIWDGVLGSDPGYRAFGYVNTGPCSPGPTTHSNCSDPDHYFEWFWGHPSRVTHKIMADYVREVLDNCRVL
ncbi:hypothetical protein L210DRAFT_3567550 [Boletus edulis BED1]|uniref:Carbohydrate esterase family 16 protein n=1 Tax=Boletus edulis BED1 TaxID=1328754 RepID=A0AAD4G7H0_BOLED|nr:hypothetical protein L210DRAFT_3567550 [Boletus edulis BED1]